MELDSSRGARAFGRGSPIGDPRTGYEFLLRRVSALFCQARASRVGMLMQLVLTARAWMGQSPSALFQQGLAWAANLASGLRHFSLRRTQ